MKRGWLVVFAILFSFTFVSAAHNILPASFSFDEDVNHLFNVSVNNTDSLAASNITEVNITLPVSFGFLVGTNGTSAGSHTFSNTSNVLSWGNDGLVMNLTKEYFWFNATASNPGSYDLVVTTTNATGAYSSNVSVTVNDLGDPTASFGVNPVNYYNSSNANVTFDLKCSDNTGVDILQLWSNFSGNWLLNQTNSTPVNNSFWNVSVSGIAEGKYVWGIYCNDSSGNSDWSANRTLIIDTTDPTVTFSCDETTLSVGETITCTCSGTDATSGVSTTTYTENPSTNSVGTFTTNCTVTDYSGNSKVSSVTYVVSSSSSNTNTGTTSNNVDKVHAWTKVNPDEEVVADKFDSSIGLEKVKFELNDSATNVKLNVVKYGSAPSVVSEKSGEVYKYLKIEIQNIGEKLKKAIVTLKIEKSWMEENGISKNDVSLFKFVDDSWNELSTVFTEEDDSYYYYDVELKSFSYFVIAGESKVSENETLGGEEESETQQQDSENVSGTTSNSEAGDSGSWGWIVFFIIFAGVIVFLWFKYDKKIIEFFVRKKEGVGIVKQSKIKKRKKKK